MASSCPLVTLPAVCGSWLWPCKSVDLSWARTLAHSSAGPTKHLMPLPLSHSASVSPAEWFRIVVFGNLHLPTGKASGYSQWYLFTSLSRQTLSKECTSTTISSNALKLSLHLQDLLGNQTKGCWGDYSSLSLNPVPSRALLGISSSQCCSYSWCMVLAQPLLLFFSWTACPMKSDSENIGRGSTGLCSHHYLCSALWGSRVSSGNRSKWALWGSSHMSLDPQQFTPWKS